jgi:hypothetical protein
MVTISGYHSLKSLMSWNPMEITHVNVLLSLSCAAGLRTPCLGEVGCGRAWWCWSTLLCTAMVCSPPRREHRERCGRLVGRVRNSVRVCFYWTDGNDEINQDGRGKPCPRSWSRCRRIPKWIQVGPLVYGITRSMRASPTSVGAVQSV